MSLLIRGGTLLTISEQGTFRGDLKIQGDAIAEISAYPQRLEPDTGDVTLDAEGLYVMPGLIDPFISAQAEEQDYMVQQALASGVTSMLIWDERSHCTIFNKGACRPSSYLRIDPSGYSDAQLDEHLCNAITQGLQPVVDVQNEPMCRRMLLSARRTGVKPMLFRLSGCSMLSEAIADSGCAIVPAPFGMCGSSPWQMAARLSSQSVKTSLTCAYPYTKMKHLPLCAALCVREGMPRDMALQAITSIPADLLGLTNVGRLIPGFRADLSIYDGDPLLIASSLVMTICGGRIHRSENIR